LHFLDGTICLQKQPRHDGIGYNPWTVVADEVIVTVCVPCIRFAAMRERIHLR